MAIREIPRAFEYTCDVCLKVHKQENAGGHYTNSRPPRWARLVFEQDAYDYQGSAVADGTIRRLICDECAPQAISVINSWAEGRKS